MTTDTPRPPARWAATFLAIWSGQACSLLGSRVAQFALIWWLTQLTGSATILATASLVALVPEIVLMPIAGVYIDRWNRRIVMIVADGVIALASLWLAYLFWSGAIQYWHVYVIMFVRAVGGSFHWPAMQASTSLMVPHEHLTRVAGLNQTLFGLLGIFGPPLGALCMGVLPLFGIMLIDVFTAALAIVPLLFVQVPQPPRRAGAGQASFWTDMRAGLVYLLDWRGMLFIIGMAVIFKIATTPAFTLFPLLVSAHFKGDAAQLSLLEALLGIGMVAGGLIMSAWGGTKRRIYTSLVALALSGLCFVVIGFTPATAFWLALAGVFVIGFLMPFVDGTLMAVLQVSIEPEMQGRVFTLLGSLFSISSPIGLALAGPVSDAFGLMIWYVAGGVLTTVTSLAMLFVPDVINVERREASPTRS